MKKAFKFTGIIPIYATLGDGTDVCLVPGEVYENLPEGNDYLEGLKGKGFLVEVETKQSKPTKQ